MKITEAEEENDNANRDDESESLPQAEAADNSSRHEHCQSLPPPPGNETLQSGPLHEETQSMEAIRLNEGDERMEANSLNEGDESIEVISINEEDETMEAIRLNEEEERRRKILQPLEEGQFYKDIVRTLSSLKGHFFEDSVTSIVDTIYGIDSNDQRFIFIDKKPGRMIDDGRWKRTEVEITHNGWSQVYQPNEPRTIRHGSYNVENGDQGTSSHSCDKGKQQLISEQHAYQPNQPGTIRDGSYNVDNGDQGTSSHSCDKGKQLISKPSKEKYGYLPQFYEELDSSMPGFFGNSENIEDFLVGGKEKLQEIRQELGSRSRPRSPDETQEENIDNVVLSMCDSPSGERKKVCTLWGVDLYKEDFGNTPENAGSPKPKSTDEQDVNSSS